MKNDMFDEFDEAFEKKPSSVAQGSIKIAGLAYGSLKITPVTFDDISSIKDDGIEESIEDSEVDTGETPLNLPVKLSEESIKAILEYLDYDTEDYEKSDLESCIVNLVIDFYNDYLNEKEQQDFISARKIADRYHYNDINHPLIQALILELLSDHASVLKLISINSSVKIWNDASEEVTLLIVKIVGLDSTEMIDGCHIYHTIFNELPLHIKIPICDHLIMFPEWKHVS